MSDQKLAARVRAALEAGEGILRLAPAWVPRSFLMPGGRLKLARQDLYALGHAPRRDRRTLVRLDDRGRQRRGAARRGAQLRRSRHRPVHAQRGHRPVRLRDDRRHDLWNTYKTLAGLQQVLRQPRADPAPHAPEPGAGRQAGPRGEARELLFPAPAQLDRQQLPLHVHGPRARHDQGRHSRLPRALERGGQRDSRSIPRPIASSREPAGWFRRACSTPPARW